LVGIGESKCPLVRLHDAVQSKRSANGSKDIWWLVWGVFLVAIVERGNILDEEKKWFDMFRVLFELVSAFGGIGLSLGLPSVSQPNPTQSIKPH